MRVRLLVVLLVAFAAVAQDGGKLRVPDAQQFVGAPQGQPITGNELAVQTHRVGSLLRCPVCQGMAVADSPSEMAVNMKHQVRELLARGYTEDQILKYFELSYGQFVLLKPKFEGVNSMVWLMPIIALVIGGAIVFVTLKRLEKGPASETPTANRQLPTETDPYLARVRELVSGDKS